VWDLGRSQEPLVLRGHETGVSRLAFSADGQGLVSADREGTVKTWRSDDGKKLSDSRGAIESAYDVTVSRSGKRMAWPGQAKGTIRLRDVASGKESVLPWKDHNPCRVLLSDDDRWLAAVDLKKEVAVWDVADGKQTATLDELTGTAQDVTFSADSKLLAVTEGIRVLLWDWQAGKTRGVPYNREGTICALAISADRKLLATAAGNPARGGATTVRIWDLERNQRRAEFTSAGQPVSRLVFSPDGRRLATAAQTQSGQGFLKLWDTASGREVFSAALPVVSISDIAFSPDGHRLAAAVQAVDVTAGMTGRKVPGEIHVWDATPAGANGPRR
jgi:WD40 repeat protein